MSLTPEQIVRLAEIEAKLASGVSSATVAGDRRVDYDLEELRRQRDELKQLETGVPAGSRFRRVTLGG